jgi:hypothetical protein
MNLLSIGLSVIHLMQNSCHQVKISKNNYLEITAWRFIARGWCISHKFGEAAEPGGRLGAGAVLLAIVNTLQSPLE